MIAKGLQTSRGAIRRIVEEYLGLKPFKIQRRHLISAVSEAKRLDRANETFQELRSAGDKVFNWPD